MNDKKPFVNTNGQFTVMIASTLNPNRPKDWGNGDGYIAKRQHKNVSADALVAEQVYFDLIARVKAKL